MRIKVNPQTSQLETERGETAQRITQLRESLGLSQAGFARLLKLSPMSVSRLERSVANPSPEQLVELGRMARDGRAWFFWQRAGLTADDVRKVLLEEDHSRKPDVRSA